MAARPAPHPVTLVLVVHDHQPVGNFDGVIAEAVADAYDPFLDFLERRPSVRLALHVSGPLLEWLAAHRPDHIGRLRARVAAGQVEPWGGGFYEPVLPAIPEHDRQGQIRALAEWIERHLGRRPTGLWLTERVWEPGLASTLADAGVTVTAVDDAHFVAAGFARDALWGSFLTEDQGRVLHVLPIHRELRYAIPFEAPEATRDVLHRVASGGPGRMAVLGDDGEKFGVWPGTRQRVWTEGWLDRFADMLEAAPWIRIRTPSEALAEHPPLGLAYLPSAAYHEMQEWAQPVEAQRRHHESVELLTARFGEEAADLVRGGHWRNFFTRYPEANRMHKRVVRASRRLEALGERGAAWEEARRHVWRAECNCPYWHGVFGGLYLPHLREAVYAELIAAERFLCGEGARSERGDLDLDGADDVLLENHAWAAWISTRGGALWGFDDRESGCNYADTLARRAEAYHAAIAAAEVGGGEGATIHGAVRVTEPGLAADAARRDPGTLDLFVEHWNEGTSDATWRERRFDVRELSATGVVLEAGEDGRPMLRKRFAPAPNGLAVELTLRSAAARHGRLDVDLALGLHVPDAPDRWVEVNGVRVTPAAFAAHATHDAVRSAAFRDAWAGRRLGVSVDREARLTRAPIHTVSLSERGAERVFQGLETRWSFDVALSPGVAWAVRFLLEPARERGAA
ncbi:MAG TPA: alpha-amylase/4-alpha-glucanotransferase domain-containing protein [Candidatus Saccharimonadaceae bacterium]|nr:alpha-amylase/4-alpha-glucanotransferase domain-containing protein [Candidatus Saccharimonadaceae bacterium]